MPFDIRVNRLTPEASSKSFIRLLTADAAMPSRAAARVRLRSSQIARNSRKVVRSIRRSSAASARFDEAGAKGGSRLVSCDNATSGQRDSLETLASPDMQKISKWNPKPPSAWEKIPRRKKISTLYPKKEHPTKW